MAENPLLPNAKLREMYALMQRTRRMLKSSGSPTTQEAILAATLMHLEPGDFVSPATDNAVLAALASERVAGKNAPSLAVSALAGDRRLSLAAAVAQGMKLAGSKSLAAVFAAIGSAKDMADPTWQQTLTEAQKLELPLLLICAGTGRGKKGVTWEGISAVARKSRIPVLTVDGLDAVAVYRVMQESTQRARTRLGPAVLWCSLEQPEKTVDSLAGLRKYMSVRKISLRSK